jgi:hypothetical protein
MWRAEFSNEHHKQRAQVVLRMVTQPNFRDHAIPMAAER